MKLTIPIIVIAAISALFLLRRPIEVHVIDDDDDEPIEIPSRAVGLSVPYGLRPDPTQGIIDELRRANDINEQREWSEHHERIMNYSTEPLHIPHYLSP